MVLRGDGQPVSPVRLTADRVSRAMMTRCKIPAQLSKQFAHLLLTSHQSAD